MPMKRCDIVSLFKLYFKDEILATPQVESCNQQPNKKLKDGKDLLVQISDSPRFEKQVIGLSFRVDNVDTGYHFLQNWHFVFSLIKVIWTERITYQQHYGTGPVYRYLKSGSIWLTISLGNLARTLLISPSKICFSFTARFQRHKIYNNKWLFVTWYTVALCHILFIKLNHVAWRVWVVSVVGEKLLPMVMLYLLVSSLVSKALKWLALKVRVFFSRMRIISPNQLSTIIIILRNWVIQRTIYF